MISTTKRQGCIPATAFLMAIVICVFACNNSKQPAISTKWGDTCYVAYIPKNNDSTWAILKAVDSMGKVWAYGDSAHSDGVSKVDTFWKFRVQDVVRDSTGKPILDSAKQPKPIWNWVTLSQLQKQSINIHVLPKNK